MSGTIVNATVEFAMRLEEIGARPDRMTVLMDLESYLALSARVAIELTPMWPSAPALRQDQGLKLAGISFKPDLSETPRFIRDLEEDEA